jgi:hypothetical protein
MRAKTGEAILYLNDKYVGRVKVHGWETSWGYGDFEPNEDFAPFAPIFGRWSLLMHEDEGERLTPDASEELQQAEVVLDTLRARLHFAAVDEWMELGQVNIDGPLIEWKAK